MESAQQAPRDRGYETIEAPEYRLRFLWNGGNTVTVLHKDEGASAYEVVRPLLVHEYVDYSGSVPTAEETYQAISMELAALDELGGLGGISWPTSEAQ